MNRRVVQDALVFTIPRSDPQTLNVGFLSQVHADWAHPGHSS